jgi:hypothetical protein
MAGVSMLCLPIHLEYLSLSAIPALIVLFFIIRLPDTPRWLLMNGQREEVLDLIRKVEGDVDPEEEVQRIEEDLAYEEKGSFLELFQGHFRLASFFVITLGFLVQITGINAIVYPVSGDHNKRLHPGCRRGVGSGVFPRGR